MTFRDPFPILYAADVARAVEFYRDLLGFEPGYRWPQKGDEVHFQVLRLGAYAIAVARNEAPERLYGRRPVSGSPPRFELCIYCDDTDAAAERLRAGGASELRAPEDMPWGERLAYFEDPDGNPIQITAEIPKDS
jgi:lactoylglutathione lyase